MSVSQRSTIAFAVITLWLGSAGAVELALPADLSSWACTGQCGASGNDGDIIASPFGSPRYAYVSTSGSEATGVSPLHLDSNSRGNGTETNGSKLVSPEFHAGVGDRIDLQFNYVSTDGKGFDDYGWARVLSATDGSLVAWLFTARSSNSGTGNIVPGDVVTKKEFDPKLTIVNYADFNFHSKLADDPVDWSPLGSSNGSCWKANAAGCGYTDWLHSRYAFAAGGDYRIEVGVVNWGDAAFDSGLAFDLAGLSAPAPAPVPEPASATLMLAALGVVGMRLRPWRAGR
jgi:hypothetical protein